MSDASRRVPLAGAAADEDVGWLLREAGMRQDPPAERAERVRRVVLDEWRAVARARKRRLRLLTGGVVLAAAAALFIAVRLATPPEIAPRPAAPVATVDRVTGEVRRAAADGQPSEPTLAAGDRLVAGEAVETGAAGRVSVLAGVNTSVRVAANSRVRWLSAGDLVLERGTVYVDNQAPLDRISVQTPLGVVRDIGTQYEVRLQANALRVRVRSGRVELRHGGQVDAADRGVEITLENGVLRRQTVAVYGPEWAWTERLASHVPIEGRRLNDVLTRLSREQGWTLRYADQELARHASTVILTGTVEGLRADEALAVIIAISGLDYRLEGGELMVSRP